MLDGLEMNPLLKILSNLRPEDLRIMSLVNKRFAEFIRQKPLWWNLLSQHFPDLTQQSNLNARQLQQYQNDPQALFVALSAEDKGRALRNAAYRGHIRLVSALLVEVGDAISPLDKGTALHQAGMHGHLGSVEALLAEEIISTWDKGLVLRCAAFNGHLPIVDILLTHVIDVSDEGMALYHTARNGHLLITLLLLNRVGYEMPVWNKGEALSIASLKGHRDIVDLLIKKVGKQVTADYKGKALENAIVEGYPDIAETLLSQIGDDISVQYKVDALSIAALKRCQTSMSLLLERCGHEMSFLQIQSAIGFIPASQFYASRAFNALRGMMGAVPMVLTENPPEMNQPPLLLVGAEVIPQRFPFADEPVEEEVEQNFLKHKVDEEDEELTEEVVPSHKRRKIQGG